MVLDDDDLMPFGKYKGHAMSEVPDSYLLDLFQKTKKRPSAGDMQNVYDYTEANLDAIMINISRRTFKNLIPDEI